MCEKRFYLIVISLALCAVLPGTGRAADANLMGWWPLDGDGVDVSGNGRNGTLQGTPQFGPGVYGEAMEFDGDDYVTIDGYKGVLGTNPWSVTAWFKTTTTDTLALISWGTAANGQRIEVRTINGVMRANHGAGNVNTASTVNDGEWHHIALTTIANAFCQYPDMIFYLDGQDDTVPSTDTDPPFNIVATADVGIGYRSTHNDRFWDGAIDDVRMFDKVLTPDEVLEAMESGGEPYPFASSPDPADGALIESTWVNLAWSPGGLAVSHDVYLGESADDVNDGVGDTFRGNQTSTAFIVGFPGFPYPEGLAPGTTYYWRIDEINDAEPNSPWKGPVWSFTIPSLTAYNVSPVDGAKFIDRDVTLSWTPGYGAKLHHLYFGDNPADVNDGTADTYKGALPDTTYTPGTLEPDKVYYWRVDEFDGAATHKGNVLSFRTEPAIPVADSNLACWWMLDEGIGNRILDWSGHGHDATFGGSVDWINGYDGLGLHFAAETDLVAHSLGAATDWPAGTVALWVRADSVGQNEFSSVFSSYYPNTAGFQMDVDGAVPGDYRVNFSGGQILAFGPVATTWVHLAMSFEGTSANLYYNGEWAASGALADTSFNQFAIGTNRNAVNSIAGIIDDFRMYDKALTEDEVRLVMRIDPLLAWSPSPANGSTPDIDSAVPLTWSPGDNASSHEVYFGTDKDAVANADTSDTTGVYRGRQNSTSFTPSEGVEWAGGPYYWRIDEQNTAGTVTRGRIWSFTVADFILVDDFEGYTDDDAANEAIWQSWIDGFGVPGNGSQVGYLLPPYAERTIINGGAQSMPLAYDNTAGVTYSEAELMLTAPRDWTRHEVTELSIWFRGYPGTVGSFTEGPVGTYTMTGSGTDIWGTADEFHFAYKTLTGAGSIVAKVDSVSNTHVWAKAGVMIRETLDAGSKHAFACVTPGSGVAFQRRTDTDNASTSTAEAGITAPHWVKVERDAGGNFTVSRSTNGTTWVPVAGAVPMNIPMTSAVYIGLALTSHDAAQTCQAKFSNVSTTGTVSAQWAHQDVGISSNAAEPLYVALSNKTGTPAVVYNDDANAATIDTWTQWIVPLQAFADQGINLSDVDRVAIGLGARSNPTTPGGSGTLFIDDITLLRSAAGQP